MVVGSGMLWGEAYDYAMCILEEMQWIKTKSIHAAEFFHGALELVEKDTSLLLFYGEDETQPLMDRVLNFSKKITNTIGVFDTKEVVLPFTDSEYRKIVSPMVLYAITERLSCYLEKVAEPSSHHQKILSADGILISKSLRDLSAIRSLAEHFSLT